MDKQTQDRLWASLPKEEREEIRKQYRIISKNPQLDRCDSVYLTELENIFGHHNLTSDTEPEEMLMVSKSKVMERIKYLYSHPAHIAAHKADERASELRSLFGDQYLNGTPNTPNSGELKSQEADNKPRFKVGDKVIVSHFKKVGVVREIKSHPCIGFNYEVETGKDSYFIVHEAGVEPYTEPETKPLRVGDKVKVNGEDKVREVYRILPDGRIMFGDKGNTYSVEELELIKPETKDNMEEKELNLVELLKGCIGEWFYVTPCGEMELKEINKLELKPLHFSRDAINCLTKTDGRAYENGSCIIYPSRALYEKYPLDAYSAWMEWKEARKPKRWIPQIGERIFWVNSHGTVSQDVCRRDIEGNGHQLKRRAIGNEFKTGKEAQQAAEAMRECLEKFHEDQTQP